MSPQMYDFAQAAERLGISESTLRKWVARRRVQHHRLGRLVRFTDDDIAAAVTLVPPIPKTRQRRPGRR
jgi:excisionase family DNA binding protein